MLSTLYSLGLRTRRFLRRINSSEPAAPTHGGASFEVNAWIVSDFVVRDLVPSVGVSTFPVSELMLLASAVVNRKPTRIFEWGTNIGLSALVFSKTARRFGIPAEIHSIDLPPGVEHQEHPGWKNGILVRGRSDVTLHRGDGLETTLRLAKQAPPNARILVFVDGDHSYESVHRELTTLLRELPNADILLHDTFDQGPESGYNVGPARAIDDVLRESGAAYERIDTRLGRPGMTLLYRR